MSKVYVATHAILFRDEPTAPGAGPCDVCGDAIPDDDGDDVFASTAGDRSPAGRAPPGRGLFLSTRGGEVRYEEPPLCASCGSAIGVVALAQWDIEEEEG